MGVLKQQGIPLTLGGREFQLLFTLNAIDAIQDAIQDASGGKNVVDALSAMFSDDQKEMAGAVKTVLAALLNDDVERWNWKHPEDKKDGVTEQEVGWMVDIDNLNDVRYAILKAYHISMPEPEEDADPNAQGSRSA